MSKYFTTSLGAGLMLLVLTLVACADGPIVSPVGETLQSPTPTQMQTPTPPPTATVSSPLPPPPASLGLDPFYEKYLDADGLPIVSSSKVPDAALYRARDIIDDMLALRPDIRATLAELGVRVAILAESEVITDIPEYSDLYEAFPDTDWNTRARGLGPTFARPAVSAAEENILCYIEDNWRYEDILVHEFAHAVFEMGVEQQKDGYIFRNRLAAAYQVALDAGLWEGTYAATNANEYWAEGVQSWFGLNDPPGPIHNDINTRAELKAYDPALAQLILEVFGDVEVTSSCHETFTGEFKKDFSIQGVVTGPNSQPLAGIGLWAWQGYDYNSGFGGTGEDGRFLVKVPEGIFSLDLYWGDGCLGWYDGSGSITTNWDERASLVVDGESIEGLEIRLTQKPSDLPTIGC